MEIILKQDVEKLGIKDDIATVKPGYGRNYLIPQGLAVLATPSAKKVLAENVTQRAHKEAKLVEDANKVAEGSKALEIKITAQVGAGNRLFGSVTSADIAEKLSSNGHEIEKKFIM